MAKLPTAQAMGRANKASRDGYSANQKIQSQMAEQQYKQQRIDGIMDRGIKKLPAPPGTKMAKAQDKARVAVEANKIPSKARKPVVK